MFDLIFVLVCVVLFIFVLAFLVHLLIRNNRVYEFRRHVSDLCAERNYEQRELYGDRVTNFYEVFYHRLPPYINMVFSFKKLELESYFGPSEIERLTLSLKQHRSCIDI